MVLNRKILYGALLPLALAGALLLGRADQVSRFDRTVWIAHPDLDKLDTPRARMVNDLMDNYLKPGMTRTQVHQLLGEPDSTSEFDAENHREGFGLGHIGPFGIDPSVLYLQYDSSEKLKSWSVVET